MPDSNDAPVFDPEHMSHFELFQFFKAKAIRATQIPPANSKHYYWKPLTGGVFTILNLKLLL
jgi:hypothetical protein